MLAVIKTGGKQYKVSPGDKIKIEKIESPASAKAAAGKKEGKEITFTNVLLLEKQKPRTRTSSVRGAEIEIGNPQVKGAKVVGKILQQGKGKKVIVFKYKPKTRYKKKKGHRQPYTEIEIVKIESGK